MHGPLVLAGVDVESDIFVPKGGSEAAKKDPAGFIRRTSNATLIFEATAEDGSTMKMLALRSYPFFALCLRFSALSLREHPACTVYEIA
eukprot:SAG11_NODE_1194_length_5548_cov_3.456414_8_plen_88_part_01